MEFLQDDTVFDTTGKHANVDVVCGMDIIEEKCKHRSEYRGSTYYFCSSPCQKHFDDYPERYVWDEA